MNDPNQQAAMVGYVLLALASLAGLAVALKQLFKPSSYKLPSYGNGTHDVTRREFEDEKSMVREISHKLTDRIQELEVEVAILREQRGLRLHRHEEDDR